MCDTIAIRIMCLQSAYSHQVMSFVVRFAICLCFLVLYTCYLIFDAHTKHSGHTKEHRTKPLIHVCLRTKNSIQYLDEFIRYHTSHGVTSFSVYDDSDAVNEAWAERYPEIVQYTHVGGREKIPNENFYVWNCFVEALMEKNPPYDFVMNMDDDEFIFTTSNQTMADAVSSMKEVEARCFAMPLYFFGTKQSSHSGLTTIDFVNRERDYPGDAFVRYTRQFTDKHTKLRTTKAIFVVPDDITHMISILGNYMTRGALIHGYGIECRKQDIIRVAHYTRSSEDLRTRMGTFWSGVRGLEQRFDAQAKRDKYIRERNRTDIIDMTLRRYTLALNIGDLVPSY